MTTRKGPRNYLDVTPTAARAMLSVRAGIQPPYNLSAHSLNPVTKRLLKAMVLSTGYKKPRKANGDTFWWLYRELTDIANSPNKNPARKSRHKGRRVRKSPLYAGSRNKHGSTFKLMLGVAKRRAKRRAKRNPKTAGHFVYVEYNKKKYWLTDLSRLDTDKSKAKRFPDLISAKIAARGIGPRVSDKVEGIWVT